MKGLGLDAKKTPIIRVKKLTHSPQRRRYPEAQERYEEQYGRYDLGTIVNTITKPPPPKLTKTVKQSSTRFNMKKSSLPIDTDFNLLCASLSASSTTVTEVVGQTIFAVVGERKR